MTQFNPQILGGYVFDPRCFDSSDASLFPPHTREIFKWLVRNANFEDKKVGGLLIKRGQRLTSYDEIIEGLKWKIGFRVERYTRSNCENAMKTLTNATMIATRREGYLFIVTILNYDIYQNPNLYEKHNDRYDERYMIATRSPHDRHDKEQERKNERTEERITNTETVVNPFIKAVSPSSVARDGKKNTANKNSGKNKIYANAIRGYEQYIQSDTHKLIDRLVASEGLYPDGLSESETIRIWAFAIQARIKRNPAGWFSNAISECQYPPSDEALALAKQEYYLQEQNYVDSEIASKISAFLQR